MSAQDAPVIEAVEAHGRTEAGTWVAFRRRETLVTRAIPCFRMTSSLRQLWVELRVHDGAVYRMEEGASAEMLVPREQVRKLLEGRDPVSKWLRGQDVAVESPETQRSLF